MGRNGKKYVVMSNMNDKNNMFSFQEAIKASSVSFRDAFTLIRNGCPTCKRKWLAQIKFGTLVYQCPECKIEFVKYDPKENLKNVL